MELGANDLVLAGEDVVAEKLLLHILEAQPLDGVGEAFAGLALLAEEQDCLLDDAQHFLLRGEYRVKRLTLCNLLAPASANVDAVAVLAVRHCLERALGDTASAVIADVLVDLQHAVDHLRRADRAVVLDLADLAAAAEIRVKLRDALADDAQIVEVWFDTVVRASADRNLKLVRQLDALVALVEALVNLLGQVEAVEQAVLAGGSLAGHNWTNLRAGAAGLQTQFIVLEISTSMNR